MMKDAVASKFELSQKQFGTHVKLYVDAECITKKNTNSGAVYTIYPELCKEFMKSQDWYVEI
jgi:Cdc6-like AAA superfamily ATPase